MLKIVINKLLTYVAGTILTYVCWFSLREFAGMTQLPELTLAQIFHFVVITEISRLEIVIKYK